MKKEKWIFLILALFAFLALGLEVILAFWLEPGLFGAVMNEWSDRQNILHWLFTCALWGCAAIGLIQAAKKYEFHLFESGSRVLRWQWIVIAVLLICNLIISWFDWHGSKIIKEFYANRPVKFVFQYIYYTFEAALILLILAFGQRAYESWTQKTNIPFGGILLAVTWGAAHFFTQDFRTGVICMISALSFGCVYLLTNRDIRKTFPIVWLMFVL